MSYDDQRRDYAPEDEYKLMEASEEEMVDVFIDGHCPHCGNVLHYGVLDGYEPNSDAEGYDEEHIDFYTLWCYRCRVYWGGL